MESNFKNLRRVIRDKQMLLTNPLFNENIYVLHDDENIGISRACIIGPKNTPYENGIYFFEFRFPDNYPFEPFKVKFFTNDGKTRMHPNFYACGKVCVSIIGTWSGPGWTSCQTLSSVLLTIQSLFIENPLWQEPGFDNDTSSNNVNYNKIIKYENIRIAILKMYNQTPLGFEKFRDIMKQHILLNRNRICEQVNEIKAYNMALVESPSIWHFNTLINYDKLNKNLEELYGKLEELNLSLFTQDIDKKKVKYKEFYNRVKNISDKDNTQSLMAILNMSKIINIVNNEVTIL